MPDGGLLIIETRNIVLREADVKGQQNLEPGRYVLLRVSDTGAGMDDHTLGHIFDPFFTTKEVGQGTGLGLSTVYGIVQAHGGMITCSSAPDQGAAFEIYLPAVSREAAAGTKAEPHLSQPLGGTESILIVDDESAILEVAEEMLSASGYRVQTATTGEEALDCVAQSEAGVDLVLLDLGMPGMGGETCLRKLKEMDPEIKVIIASGYLTDQGLESVMDSGAQGFLPKPYRLGDLLTKIRGVLDADSGD
jgi:CheY-like chemotaxis protein